MANSYTDKALECDAKYIELLAPYLEQNYSNLSEYARQLFMPGNFHGIEKDFKEFPIQDTLKSWKAELTDILLLEKPEPDRKGAEIFADIHVTFCCGIVSTYLKNS